MKKQGKKVVFGPDGKPLRHSGWGGNMRQHRRNREERWAAQAETTTHPYHDEKFGDGTLAIDYSLLREMEGR